ncbi:MAG: response regulator transcription factor [Caldilineaceae bacterium]
MGLTEMRIKVLLADDHTALRKSLHTLLDMQSDLWVVGEAANGVDAVRQATQLCPDVVVLDVIMPELNGFNAAQMIRELCPTTAIVLYSLYVSAKHIEQALQAGADAYVLKESAGDELIEAIRTVYQGRNYLSQEIFELLSQEQRVKYLNDELRHRSSNLPSLPK